MLPHTLRTARLVLRRPRLVDAHALFAAYACDPEVTRYLVWPPHVSVDATVQYVQRCLAEWEGGETLTWLVCEASDDAPVGALTLRFESAYKGQLGYVLARRCWGKGYMTEAVRTVIAAGLGDGGLYRVAAFCDVENRASARVMEKAGMTLEGTLRRYAVHPNRSPEPRDVHLYATCR